MYKENEVKTKMVQKQWLELLMKFLLGYKINVVFSGGNVPSVWGRDKDLVGGGLLMGTFPGGDGEQIFS